MSEKQQTSSTQVVSSTSTSLGGGEASRSYFCSSVDLKNGRLEVVEHDLDDSPCVFQGPFNLV